MKEPLDILILSDGKPGHANQSFGLAQAIGRIRPVRVSKISLKDCRGLFHRLRGSWRECAFVPRPDLLIGAGHAVHAALLVLSRRFDAPCVVLMKPTLPAALFDLSLVPEHDLRGSEAAAHVIPTLGALNGVPPPDDRERLGGLILIGGPSAAHGWDAAAIREAVTSIVSHCGDRPWRITDSRRSPPGTLDGLARECPALVCYPHADTGRDWLPQRLAEAAEVWVTEDSVSMIYEALSSGARVGLLPVPLKKKAGRVARGIDRLVERGFATRYADWSPEAGLAAPPRVLREADRCATIVLESLALP